MGIESYSKGQLTALVILRMLIGWHFLYEGVVKLWNPGWSAAGYLMDSQGFMAKTFINWASNPSTMNIIDFLNVWGLILIGVSLLLGLFTKIGAIGGIVMLAMFYLSHPALINVEYALPTEGSYLFVNKNLIELCALAVILYFPTSKLVGFDRFIEAIFKK